LQPDRPYRHRKNGFSLFLDAAEYYEWHPFRRGSAPPPSLVTPMASTPPPTTAAESEQPHQAVRIYHNPQCARSREALEYLRQQGIQPQVIEYLVKPLSVDELRQLVRMLGIAPSSLIRAADFKRLGLRPTSDYDKLLQLLSEHPVLMDRPIVVVGNEARIGRPIENLHGLFPNAPLRRKT
jgi:arsenate reductase